MRVGAALMKLRHEESRDAEMSELEGPETTDAAMGPENRPPKRHRIGLGTRLRNYFLAGILITAPVGLTIYIAWLFV